MSALHRELAGGRWYSFSIIEQLANVGSEVERAMSWAARNRPTESENAAYRALDLLDLTISDPRHVAVPARLRELTRLREVFLDYFFGDNAYGSTVASWKSYFGAFGMAAALERERRAP